MPRRPRLWVGALFLGALLWLGTTQKSQAQQPYPYQTVPLNKAFYYPYYYFPHNYWPNQSPRWPEPPGAKPLPAPAYMAYPPFLEPNWRYYLFQPLRHYRGNHFWLDQL